eukprot:jgi/Tetstr1/425081/TSEL_015545.t1
MAATAPAGTPSPPLAAPTPDVDAAAAATGQPFLDDVYNMVNDYTADGFDTLEAFVRTQLPADAAARDALQEGVQVLYLAVQSQLERRLAEFEVAARHRCFAQPEAPAAGAPGREEADRLGAQGYSEAEEAAVDGELTELRTAIALGRAQCKQMQKDISLLSLQVAQYGDASQLERVLQEVGPQDVGANAASLAECAAALKPLLATAQRLREGRRPPAGASRQDAAMAATKAVNRRKLEVSGASLQDLRQLRQQFGLPPP